VRCLTQPQIRHDASARGWRAGMHVQAAPAPHWCPAGVRCWLQGVMLLKSLRSAHTPSCGQHGCWDHHQRLLLAPRQTPQSQQHRTAGTSLAGAVALRAVGWLAVLPRAATVSLSLMRLPHGQQSSRGGRRCLLHWLSARSALSWRLRLIVLVGSKVWAGGVRAPPPSSPSLPLDQRCHQCQAPSTTAHAAQQLGGVRWSSSWRQRALMRPLCALS
jgi:hypothetical protein